MLDRLTTKTALIAVAITVALTSSMAAVIACPFCSAVNLTFTEQLKSNDVVVIAKLLKVPEISDDPDADLPKAEFEVVDVIKGGKWVRPEMKFRTLLVGRYPVGQEFMVMGVDDFKFSLSPEFLLIPGLIVLAVMVGIYPAISAYRTDVANSLGK